MIAQNPEGAQPGELVLVRSRPGKMLAACLMMPVLPVVGFFAGYLVGAAFWNAGRLSGCIALAFGIGAAVIYDRRTASKPGSGYTIIRYP
jgi:positive regulator of sigma E activity